jgi:hypothetical protein
MTTVKEVEVKFTEHQNKGVLNTYMTPSKNMKDWLKDELLFVRKIETGYVVVFRALDGTLHSLNEEQLLNFTLL